MTTCSRSGKDFAISENHRTLLQSMSQPEPTLCFEEEMKHLLSFWPSIGRWYKRTCDATGKTIITNYPESARFPVYISSYFDSDAWDAPGMEIGFGKDFFEQLQILQEMCPRPHMLGINNENCDYCDDMWNSKNSFLTSSQVEADNVYFGYRCIRCSWCTDIVMSYDCDQCHSVSTCTNCFKLFWAFNCEQVSASAYMFDCRQCDHCFMCWNLRDKKYCILNKQYTKEEYDLYMQQIDLGSREKTISYHEKFQSCIQQHALHPVHNNTYCEQVEGDWLTNCKGCDTSFAFQNTEDSSWLVRGIGSKNIVASAGVLDCEKCYHVVQSSYLYNCKNVAYSANCKNSEYLDNCKNCSNCFGCISLKDKEYCILNKQYTKEEYTLNVKKIKENMIEQGVYGNFFPLSMMYSGYNTTLARLYFPQTKNQILGQGGYWEDDQISSDKSDMYTLEDNIRDISDDLSSKRLLCETSQQVYNFPKQVVDLHKKLGIPLSGKTHLLRLEELYRPLTNIIGKEIEIEGNIYTHYYPDYVGYKHVITRESYDEQVQ